MIDTACIVLSIEHDVSRQSISKDEVASAPAVVGLAKNNSFAEIRSSRKSARKSRGLGLVQRCISKNKASLSFSFHTMSRLFRELKCSCGI